MMERKEPILFKKYPKLSKKVPWIKLLTNSPTSIERLTYLEDYLNLSSGEIYIKRDDKNHHIFGGNKLRKFEFLFGDILKKKKKGLITIGGIGSNHILASAIITKELGLKFQAFLIPQLLTWHVQRYLLLFNYFNANMHLCKSFYNLLFRILLYRLFHPKYYLIMGGGTPFLGIGTPLGTIAFINAILELKTQIDENIFPEPDVIFVAGGTTGTAAGLISGCKLLDLKSKIYVVAVSEYLLVSYKNIIRNCNKALKFLHKRDKTIPNIKVTKDDFKIIYGYLGSDYGVNTIRSQNTVDLIMELEGNKKDFKLETTYTGKTFAALIDFITLDKNKSKRVLFWNTNNSNDLNKYLKETNFNFKQLPKEFHKFFEKTIFQCWQIKECEEKIRISCPQYYNEEYRCWRIKNCKDFEKKSCKAYEKLSEAIELEDA